MKEVERFDITPETIVVGHSTGGGFWLRYLIEHPEIHIAKAVLVAPWMDVEKADGTDFFDFEFNPKVANQIGEIVVFSSEDDSQDIHKTVDFLRNNLPSAKFVDFKAYGHFTLDKMGSPEFPALLEECLKYRLLSFII